MAEYHESSGWKEWLSVSNNLWGVGAMLVGGAWFLSWLFGLPRPLLLILGSAATTLLCVFMVGRMFVSNARPIESIGGWRYEAEGLPDSRSYPPLPPESKEQEGLTLADIQRAVLQEIERTHELKKIEPNIQYKIPRITHAHRGKDGIIFEREILRGENGQNLQAVVAPLENYLPRSNKKIVGVQNISARLTYRFFDESLSFEINRGAWLSKETCTVDFGINDSNELVVATIEDENRLFVNSCRGSQTVKVARGAELTQDLVSVSVSLIAETESKIVKTFDYILEITRQPEFKVELHLALIWKMYYLSKFQSQGYDLMFKLYDIWKQAREKGEFISDLNAGVQEWKKQQEEHVANIVKFWEAEAATFIGLHVGERQKKSFLEAYPSVEQGLQKARRLPLLSRPGQETKSSEITSSHWTLVDSIDVRVKQLDKLREGLR